jgi:hypothetical protein
VLGQGSTTTPLMDGTAAVGTSTRWAHGDHVHPSDTSKIGDAPSDGTIYGRKNAAWIAAAGAGGGGSIIVSDTAPPSPTSGTLWWNSTTGQMYIWYVDPDSSQWVIAAPMPDLSSYIQLICQDTAPTATGSVPLFWWKTTNGQLFISYYDGDSTQWVAVTPNPVAAIQYDVNQNLTTTQQQQAQANLGLVAVQMRSFLAGLGMIWVSGSSFTVSPGTAADSTNTVMITLNAAMTKTLSAWAAGSGNGGLDTGTIAAGAWYHMFVIRNPTTLAVDVLFSASATAPTLPSGYTQFRRVGSNFTQSSLFQKFTQLGDDFQYAPDSYLNISNGTVPTSPTLVPLTVPSGIQVEAQFSGLAICTAAGALYFWSPDRGPITQFGGHYFIYSWGNGVQSAGQFRIRTNTSAQIYVQASAAMGTYYIGTYGYIDRRGRDL